MDDEQPYSTCGIIITSVPKSAEPEKRPLALLYRMEKPSFGLDLAKTLEQQGIKVQWVKLEEQISSKEGEDIDMYQGYDIISLIDLEGPFFADIPEATYNTFIKFLSRRRDGLLWLTRSAQVKCTDPRYGIGLGLFRTIRNELSLELWSVEVDDLSSSSVSCVLSIYQKFQSRPSIDLDRSTDTEYAILNGAVYTGRYHWISPREELESHGAENPKQMVVGNFGQLNSLHWIQHDTNTLQDNEVEVEVKSAGVNFKVSFNVGGGLFAIYDGESLLEETES